ncbi:MAG: tRNA (adenosine(37)-N6)-dimethylallyltransferase MiaA [Oscillospiraceae bacterium]|nr:tRNA (adenosine(37)-N6)-dimethylallyltransferase MiaA [Oscillospiraceae bacterium]
MVKNVVGIVGPTGTGKTALGVTLAHALDGEIVSCDSMQVYRAMPIATAQPSAAERGGIPHHLMDWLEPTEKCSVVRWCTAARAVIADIHARGKLPIVVGGTGLYYDALTQDFRFDDPAPSRGTPPYHTLTLGLDCLERAHLYARLDARVDAMLSAGLWEETARLALAHEHTAAQAIGHKELRPALRGEITKEEAVENLKRATRRYAKRQRTWFLHQTLDVHWLYLDDGASDEKLHSEAIQCVKKWMEETA